jgi:hypothetical protein
MAGEDGPYPSIRQNISDWNCLLGIFSDGHRPSDGLDRFRDFAVSTISVKQGLSDGVVGSVLAAKDGSVWLGTQDGLNRWNDGQITIYHKRSGGLPDDELGSLFQDDHGRIWASTLRGVAYFENGRFITVNAVPAGNVHSMAGDSVGNLWISQDEGLFHLLGGNVVEGIPWARLGRKDEQERIALRYGSLGSWKTTIIRSGCIQSAASFALPGPSWTRGLQIRNG